MTILPSRLPFLLSVLFVVCGFTPAISEGSLVVYTSRTAYDAATQNNTLVDFEDSNTTPQFYNPFMSNGVTFGSTTQGTGAGTTGNVWSAPYNPPPAGSGGWYGNLSDALTIQGGVPNEFTVSFPSATSAGVDLFMFSGSEVLTITTPDGCTATVTASNNSYSFLGVTSATPFTSLTITGSGNNFGIDNFDVGEAITQVPEPSSATMFLLSLLLVTAGRRRV